MNKSEFIREICRLFPQTNDPAILRDTFSLKRMVKGVRQSLASSQAFHYIIDPTSDLTKEASKSLEAYETFLKTHDIFHLLDL